MTKKGEEMWKTELETLEAIFPQGETNVPMSKVIPLFPHLSNRAVYYRIDRLVRHYLVQKTKVNNHLTEISVTRYGALLLR